MQQFLDTFQKQSKREQDSILLLAVDPAAEARSTPGRREFYFLDRYLKRACFEQLIGVSSHRIDRIGALDLRFGRRHRPSALTASVDSFAMILYNSIAEALPDRPHGFSSCFTVIGFKLR